MALTKERVSILNEFLSADKERTEKLASFTPSEAVAQINAYGHDFTETEIVEYGEAIRTVAASSGELDLDALDEVAGGSISTIVDGIIAVVNAIKSNSSISISIRW